MISKISNKFLREISKKIHKEINLKSGKNNNNNINNNKNIFITKTPNFNFIIKIKYTNKPKNLINEKNIQAQKYSRLYEDEYIKLEKLNREIEKIKTIEENKELNINRRIALKKEKEKIFLNKIENYKNEKIEKNEKFEKEKYTEDNEIYTEKEMENLFNDPNNNEIILYRMTSLDKIYSLEKMKFYKFFSGFCFIASFAFDYFFPLVKKGFLLNFSYYSLLFIDYSFFFICICNILKEHGTVFYAKYIHKDKIIEISYLFLSGRERTIRENLSDLKRKNTNQQIFSGIISNKTNTEYVFIKNKQEINDRKLFNFLFPKIEIKNRKIPSTVDSLWEKN
jgi:hypothetical protein